MVKVFQGTDKEHYMDGYLQSNLDIAKETIKKDWDMVIVVDGPEGCLTGDTEINVNRCSLGRKYTLQYMYKQFHQRNVAKKTLSKMWNLNHPTFVRSYDGISIRLHKIKDVVYSGEKPVYLVRLLNGKSIKATADHKIMTDRGWKRVDELTFDKVMCDTLRPQKGKQKSFKLRDINIKTIYHPYQDKRGEVEVHRLIFEARMNKLNFREFLDILWNDKDQAKGLFYVNPEEYHIHHKDGCHYNNHIDNLDLINKSDHHKLHSKTEEGFRHFNQGIPSFSEVISVQYFGMKKTYDIVCEDPHHNFVANGIVVHNSGKSVLTMQMAHYCDPSFNLDRVVFTPKDFRHAIINSQKYQSVVYDEAYTGLSSRATMSLINRTLISMLAEIRQKNLFVFVVMPCFFDLDKYVALWRSRALVHVYIGRNFERGYLAFYNVDKKKYLYMRGKKFYNYNDPKPNFIGRFTDGYVVDKTAYKNKKRDSLMAREKKTEQDQLRKEMQELLFMRLMETKDLPEKVKQQLSGMKRSTYFAKAKQWREGDFKPLYN